MPSDAAQDGVGREFGKLCFSSDQDTANHVVRDGTGTIVPVVRLDGIVS